MDIRIIYIKPWTSGADPQLGTNNLEFRPAIKWGANCVLSGALSVLKDMVMG